MYKNSHFNSIHKYLTMDVGIFDYVDIIQLKNFHPKFLLKQTISRSNIAC